MSRDTLTDLFVEFWEKNDEPDRPSSSPDCDHEGSIKRINATDYCCTCGTRLDD